MIKKTDVKIKYGKNIYNLSLIEQYLMMGYSVNKISREIDIPSKTLHHFLNQCEMIRFIQIEPPKNSSEVK